ncbi:MAG: hypothetical protein N2510_04140 [Ignavibacteria bacterium]|nr:hypothetical protein [Ignavibacteria bacterium]
MSIVNSENGVTLKGELLRKMIHYSSSLIPVGYYFLDKNIILAVLLSLLVGLIVVEILKYRSEIIYSLYIKYFGSMLRGHEYDRGKFRLNGASWVIISFLFCIILFPKLIAIVSMLILSFADSTSAIAGILFGKRKYAPNRTYLGTVVFFLTGALVVIFSPKYFYSFNEYLAGFIALTLTTIADGINLPVDDNFTIPAIFSFVLYILYLLFYPGFNF